MGKHKKLPKPEPSATEIRAAIKSGSLDRADRLANKAADVLEAALERGDASPQTARESGSIARTLIDISAEQRAQTKAREYTAKNLPREVLLEALRLMPTDELVVVRREIDAMLNTESVLG